MRHLFSSFPLYLAASHVLVVDLRGPFEGGSIENLVMRTVGFCALVKKKKSYGMNVNVENIDKWVICFFTDQPHQKYDK